jgi:hypothetical protein
MQQGFMSLALESKPVHVIVVHPRSVATDLWRDMGPDMREALYRR